MGWTKSWHLQYFLKIHDKLQNTENIGLVIRAMALKYCTIYWNVNEQPNRSVSYESASCFSVILFKISFKRKAAEMEMSLHHSLWRDICWVFGNNTVSTFHREANYRMSSPLNLTRTTTENNKNSFWRAVKTDEYKKDLQNRGKRLVTFMFSLSIFFHLLFQN